MRRRQQANSSDHVADAPIIYFDYGRLSRVVLTAFARRPADSMGALVAAVAGTAILVNALYLQPRPHPAPIFAPKAPSAAAKPADTTGSAAPALPRPRPAETVAPSVEIPAPPRPRAQVVTDIQRELSRRGFYDGPTDGVYGARTDAAIRDFAELAGLKVPTDPLDGTLRAIMQSPLKASATAKLPAQATAASRPNDPIAALLAPSKRVLAVQRALGDFGYGQVAPTGVFDPPTKSAIERFERERKLPISGQISDRLVRELAATTGRPLE